MSNKFPLNAKVRFTQERLSVLTQRDRHNLEGRIGVVQGYWNYTRKPTVHFPEDGSRVELRLLQADPRHLELADEASLPTEIEPALADATDDNRPLSQSELDNLFG